MATVSLPASAQATSGVAAYIPSTALVSAEFELDPESAQVTLGAELLDRANLEALLQEEDEEGLEQGLTALSLVASGEAAVFLAELPLEENVTLEDLTSDSSDIVADPESALGGDVPQGWAVVLTPDDAESAIDLYSGLVFGDDAASVEESEYNGYTILSRPAADEFSEGAAIAQVDDAIAIATVPEDIEAVIDVATGDTESLADNDAYNEVRDALEEEVLNFGFVNGPALLEALVAQDPAATAALTEDVMASFGAHQGFVFWADDPGFRLDTIAIPAEGEEIPAVEAFEPSFTGNVPDSSLLYIGGANLGENTSVNALALLIAQSAIGEDAFTAAATPVADPEAYAEEVFEEAEGLIGFNLKTELLDQLVGEWAMAGEVAELTSLEPDINAVFVTELDDDAVVADVVSNITNMIASQEDETISVSSRQVDGSDVTVIDLSEGGTPLVLEYGVVDGSLLIGINQGIDDFVDGPSSPLADSETFQDTFAELPSEVTSIAYIDVQGVLPLVEEAIALSSSSSLLDNDPACGEYDSQEEAQAAYDEDDFENFNLDLDWDGVACEDYFTTATPEAASTGVSDINVLSVGSVTFNDGDTMGSSTLIMIGE